MTFDGVLEVGFNNSAVAFIKGTELHMIAFIQTYSVCINNFLSVVFWIRLFINT